MFKKLSLNGGKKAKTSLSHSYCPYPRVTAPKRAFTQGREAFTPGDHDSAKQIACLNVKHAFVYKLNDTILFSLK